MNPRFKYRTDLVYADMESVTASNGKRVYQTPLGPASSVTTILSSIPNPALDEWRARVGDAEADRISKEATTIGSYMHNRLEAYVKAETYVESDDPLEAIAREIFKGVRTFGLAQLNVVWGIEVPLHYHDLYAGRTDLIGVYMRKRSIIDYKTSVFRKKDDYIEKYKLQIAAYALAHDWMFQDHPNYEPIEQGVIIVGIRPNPEYNKRPEVQKFILNNEELTAYKHKWIDTLEWFHTEINTAS